MLRSHCIPSWAADAQRLAEQTGADIDRSEFMRWCAETPWYPTALLPSQGVRWEAVDDHSANATMADGPLGLTLLFRFDGAGLIASFRAEARGCIVGGTMVKTPWPGCWSDDRMCHGIRVPFTGEVAWIRTESRRSYFVGTVTSLAVEFSQQIDAKHKALSEVAEERKLEPAWTAGRT